MSVTEISVSSGICLLTVATTSVRGAALSEDRYALTLIILVLACLTSCTTQIRLWVCAVMNTSARCCLSSNYLHLNDSGCRCFALSTIVGGGSTGIPEYTNLRVFNDSCWWGRLLLEGWRERLKIVESDSCLLLLTVTCMSLSFIPPRSETKMS